MRLSSIVMVAITFTCAAAASYFMANYSVKLVEENSEIGVRHALDLAEMPWAEVQADGLQVTLEGTAPTEALRFAALSTAGTIVDAARVIDNMNVVATAAITPPRFSAEILRNDAGVSFIGLIPEETDREDILERFQKLSASGTVSDLIESADYPTPEGWEDALAFGLTAMEQLPRSKVSIKAGNVRITAIADSLQAKSEMEKKLTRAAPPGLRFKMDIAAPRPVITPFTLRFVIDEQGARFDACSADTEISKRLILSSARLAGLKGLAECTVGMGVPSTKWARAVNVSLRALAELGYGSVTMSDADITLIGKAGSDQEEFDRIVGELAAALPEAFALHARLPEVENVNREGPSEFTATLSPEGYVQLRGRLSGEKLRDVVDSYAKARFGVENVYVATRDVEGLPADWDTRVLIGIEALSKLDNGAVVVTPETLSVRGNTGKQGTNNVIATLLAAKLGDAEDFSIDVTYQERLDPLAGLPTEEECEERIRVIIAENKINFEPGSATVDAKSLGTIDKISDTLKECPDLRLEIEGHTDSQGREEMNLALSQSRAQTILNELRARRVLTGSFSAKGYGEANPIADNSTPEGREANRRIVFRLIRPAASAEEGETTLESLAKSEDIPQGVKNESATEGTEDE